MAHLNSLTIVVIDVWEKAKRDRDLVEEEEEHDVRKAKHTSICSEMARRGFIIVDYSDDESDLSSEDIEERSEIADAGATPKSG
jgi:hypothetical protein